MKVWELNRSELDELKSDYYWSDDFDESITGEDDLPILFPADIPDRVICELYAATEFVKEDFFCNLED